MNILQECSGAKRIGISGHIRPDGDCVGACLALCSFLKKQLPQSQVTVFLENPPEIFKDLVGFLDFVVRVVRVVVTNTVEVCVVLLIFVGRVLPVRVACVVVTERVVLCVDLVGFSDFVVRVARVVVTKTVEVCV